MNFGGGSTMFETLQHLLLIDFGLLQGRKIIALLEEYRHTLNRNADKGIDSLSCFGETDIQYIVKGKEKSFDMKTMNYTLIPFSFGGCVHIYNMLIWRY